MRCWICVSETVFLSHKGRGEKRSLEDDWLVALLEDLLQNYHPCVSYCNRLPNQGVIHLECVYTLNCSALNH
ncbi:hypothetical protein H5410_048605 [Solanum commersonii]|uniref:Uncharacterized protein n=1 Tax=Solanum commersonii TaxID=4109 RepID=A0A9J5XIN8_SOLCO|nr:hypothetical protein H5410_048605 [Solanum commersonii]